MKKEHKKAFKKLKKRVISLEERERFRGQIAQKMQGVSPMTGSANALVADLHKQQEDMDEANVDG